MEKESWKGRPGPSGPAKARCNTVSQMTRREEWPIQIKEKQKTERCIGSLTTVENRMVFATGREGPDGQ